MVHSGATSSDGAEGVCQDILGGWGGIDALWSDELGWSIGCALLSHLLEWSGSGALWSDQLGWSISGAL